MVSSYDSIKITVLWRLMIACINRRLWTSLLCLFIATVTLTFALGSHSTVLAAGRISVTPGVGRIGDTPAMDGSGFLNGAPLRVYFSSDSAVPGNEIDTRVTSYQIVGETAASGVNLVPLLFAVPDALNDGKVKKAVTPGDYYIYVAYSDSKQIQAVAKFFVQGALLATPDNGNIGDRIGISGTGFKANNTIYLYFSADRAGVGGSIDGQVTAYSTLGMSIISKEGMMQTVSFQVPSRLTDGKTQMDVHGGDYYIYAAYYASRTRIETFTVFPIGQGSVSASPATGSVGSEIKLQGTGLRPNQELTITYDDKVMLLGAGDKNTNSSGNFSSTMVTPESAAGDHRIVAADVTGNKPGTTFTVVPKLSLSGSAVVGDFVDVSGTGFGEAQPIAVSVNGTVVATDPPILSTNRKGSFSGRFRMPQPPGAASVLISDPLHNSAAKQVDVLPAATGAPALSIDPATTENSPGHVGQKVVVQGSKFAPSSRVDITFGALAVKVASSQSDARGGFVAEFTVPPASAGRNTITASDGKTQATGSFVIESTAPPIPVLLTPKAASEAGTAPKFDWSDVSDASGVSYTFQLSTDPTFERPLLTKTGLAQSDYTLRSAETLSSGGGQTTYYWRVQATDGAGNNGAWAAPLQFFVGRASSAIPPWVTWALIGCGLVLLVVAGLWIRAYVAGRRS
jgi:hypothetical protein